MLSGLGCIKLGWMRLEAAGDSAASCAQGLEGCSLSVTVMVDDTTCAAEPLTLWCCVCNRRLRLGNEDDRGRRLCRCGLNEIRNQQMRPCGDKTNESRRKQKS